MCVGQGLAGKWCRARSLEVNLRREFYSLVRSLRQEEDSSAIQLVLRVTADQLCGSSLPAHLCRNSTALSGSAEFDLLGLSRSLIELRSHNTCEESSVALSFSSIQDPKIQREAHKDSGFRVVIAAPFNKERGTHLMRLKTGSAPAKL